ncbi:MAG TPA: hypothetical protein VEB40_03250 [Flavipsychrobacter sp.]|nr:hypothetical protein [Flavipsychrobacter sp.]
MATNNHPIQITDEKQYRQVFAYIYSNPVRAGWIKNEADYPWSSAGDEDKVPVEFLEPGFISVL